MEDEQPSVRIDIDETTAGATPGPVDAPASPDGPRGRPPWLAAGVVAIALVAVAVVLFSLQPEDGETALGDRRQPIATTTTTEPADTTTTTTEPAEESLQSIPGVDEIDLDPEIFSFDLSIIRVDADSPIGGYWMLSPRTGFASPLLQRSSDGLVWEEVGNDLPVDPINRLRRPQSAYGQLVEHESGLALLRQVTDGESATQNLERWVSANGTDWELDATYVDAVGEFLPFFTSHTSEALAYPSGELQQSRIDRLLRTAVQPEVALPESGVCFVDTFSTGFSVFACDQNDQREFELTSEDFIDPDATGEIRRCAQSVQEGDFLGLTDQATVVRFEDDEVGTVASNALPWGDAVQSNGTIVALSFGSAAFPECDQFLEPSEPIEPSIELWQPDSEGSVEQFAFPVDMIAESTFPNGPPPLPTVDTDDEIYVSLGDTVWHLDAATSEWSERLTLPGMNSFGFRPIVIVDGQAFALDDSNIVIGDLDTGETTTVPYTSSATSDGSQILVHIDDTYAFISNFIDTTLLRVELPQG